MKGAFSGAARDEVGFVRSADGGTLFLDEIGDLPATSQAALLRVLQEREVIPIGATRAVKVDVRVVAATHRPLEALADAGGFRSDLLARLKGYSHRLPALRERMADFGVVLADVLRRSRASARRGSPSRRGGAGAARVRLAAQHPRAPPGDGERRGPGRRRRHRSAAPAGASSSLRPPPPSQAPPAPASADDALRDRIVGLLHEHRGNVTAVARAMGKAPAQIHRWMHRFQIDPDTYRTGAP